MKYYKLCISFLIILFYSSFILPQQDAEKLQSIIASKTSPGKIETLKNFKSEYPESSFLQRANLELFYTYSRLKSLDSALTYGDKYLAALPSPNRTPYYNTMAYVLAENGIGLDTALIYADRAIEGAKNMTRYVNMYKDTKAFVLYKKGNVQQALIIQKEAIQGNENDPEYNYHLALYMLESGQVEEGLKFAASAVLMGDPVESQRLFNEWADKTDKKIVQASGDEVINYVLKDLTGDEMLAGRSASAAFMAQAGINMDEAKKWAEEADNSITKETSIENFIMFKKNHALVLEADKQTDDALKLMLEIEEFVDPWSIDFWLALGRIYRKNNDNEKALQAYVSSLSGYDNEPAYKAALEIASAEEIDKAVEKKKNELLNFTHGDFKGTNPHGKVVLAELFTGAECGPCAAADIAFDGLAEYYPRNTLAILEYHVHIPGPDPLTNPKTFERYLWYGGDFGTPTAFFEGTEKFTGGGPRLVANNRFNVYRHAVNKYIEDQPSVEISGNAELDGDKVNIKINVDKTGKAENKSVLHIALAEKSVNYTGANGISKHIFVVRDLVFEPEGKEISTGKFSVDNSISIKTVEDSITSYLNDPTTHKSWRSPQFSGWRLPVDKLNDVDEKNLVVVAWVQDPDTKQVLQAQYFEVK